MRTETLKFGDVLVFIDQKGDRYVTYDSKTIRFGLYALHEVQEIFLDCGNAEESYKAVFKKLRKDS